ncbi:MAG: cupredoxin domain-containing protein [Actinomycetota bacterium]
MTVRSTTTRVIVLVAALGLLVVLAARLLWSDPEPYVVTAIDYHFHDAHPTLPITPGRDLVVNNAGRNRHNVTIPALGFSNDVAPGARRTIEDIASRLTPGRYQLYCALHLDRGMKGVIVIAAD